MFRVIVKPKAEKQLEKLQRKDQKRITDALESIGNNPYTGKRLEGEYEGHWSVRVWPYRIIYVIEKYTVTVFVVAIGHRQGVYKRLQ